MNKGRKAAMAIDEYLGGEGVIDEVIAPPEEVPEVDGLLSGEVVVFTGKIEKIDASGTRFTRNKMEEVAVGACATLKPDDYISWVSKGWSLAMMKKHEESIIKLQKIRDLGIGVAIDDFGIGHSSLAYLKHLPVTKLKIDQSFMRGIPTDKDDVAIVKAIIALADGLGLDIIAEGVETEAQKVFLIENGCHKIQGYHYGKPMLAHELKEKYLKS